MFDFKNKAKEEELRERELNLKFAKMEADLQKAYMEKQLTFEIRCAEHKRKGEHDYHLEMETRKVALAKLNAEIDFKTALLKEKEAAIKGKDDLLAEKDKTIALLTKLAEKDDKVIVVDSCRVKENK